MRSILLRLRKSRRWLIELVLVVALLGGIHAYYTRDMLNADYQPAPPLFLSTLDGTANWLDKKIEELGSNRNFS